MRFTFLHAADLHLGSPFVGLAMRDEQLAARFARASRDAFSDLVSRAIEARVPFVVIAGDVYDGDWRDTSIGLFFNREVARLDRAGIAVYILKGNHDAESVRWPPDTVRLSARWPGPPDRSDRGPERRRVFDVPAPARDQGDDRGCARQSVAR